MLRFGITGQLPEIRQTEATECGLACLAMVSSFYGHKVDMKYLRGIGSISLKGAQLSSLIRISEVIGLESRAVRLEPEDLKLLNLPAILHWEMNHFVVLKEVKRGSVIIHDPRCGRVSISSEELDKKFTGVALELYPSSQFVKADVRTKVPLRSLLRNIIGLKRAIIQLLILSMLIQVIGLLTPLYTQIVIDDVITTRDISLLNVVALAFLALLVINAFLAAVRTWAIMYFGTKISFQMVTNIFSHLLRLPQSYFEKRHVGDIISRMESTSPIQTAFTQSLVSTFLDGVLAITTGIVLFYYSKMLALVVLITVALMLLVTIISYPYNRKFQEESILAGAIENSHEIESIRAHSALKLFSGRSIRLNSWKALYADTLNAIIRIGYVGIVTNAAQSIISGLQTIIIVYLGAKLILDPASGFTIGMLFAFLSFRSSFSSSIVSLLGRYIEFRLLGLHLERIGDIVNEEPEPNADITRNPFSEAHFNTIEFQSVSFRYSEDDNWVLQNLSFEIEAGSFVCLTGQSGGGKSTALKLLAGLYVPTEGSIKIDKEILANGLIELWRKKIGVVNQNDTLLSGSIIENVSFFAENFDMNKVVGACVMAGIHKEIEAMPMGYESLIGDMGSALSGGQQQRLLIARALYKNPSTILLDEGTANLDKKAEQHILEMLKQLPCTKIIVSHSPHVMEAADKVIVINSGINDE